VGHGEEAPVSVTRPSRTAEELLTRVVAAALGAVVVLVLASWLAMRAGAAIDHRPRPAGNPFAAVISLLAGQATWPGPGASATALIEIALLGTAGVLVVRWQARRGRRLAVDKAVRHLASRRDHTELSAEQATATASRLGVQAALPGVRIGRALPTGKPLYGSWEMTQADIWGARRGKTTSRVAPAVLDAPGAVVATSNKRDVVDTTRAVRAETGPVWVFDPQAVAAEPPSWWWNPLSYVTNLDKATRLAAVLGHAARPADSRQDAFFDAKGEQLLAFLLLAAAAGHAPMTTVFEWTADPTDIRPVDILRAAGHELPARSVQGVINSPDKQRAGVYGTAEKIVSFLVNPAITDWITPGAGSGVRPEFSPRDFVAGTGTLYLLSREGQGTAGPLATALTVATIEAAEELATRSPGGRLSVPLLCVLDEAANVCRWKDLPDLYSHHGSRGIVLMTMLQSWAQGVSVWGEDGMTKLWSSASIRVYGGGEADPRFLGTLSELIGDYEAQTASVSIQRGRAGSRSTTASARIERILEVSDLAALPMGRAIVFAAGTRPILVQTEPWYAGPHADRVRAAIARAARRVDHGRTGYGPRPDVPTPAMEHTTLPAAVRSAITRKNVPSRPREPA
jgi:type IV secretory pathway TraG/TraD family ATPase VirD4